MAIHYGGYDLAHHDGFGVPTGIEAVDKLTPRAFQEWIESKFDLAELLHDHPQILPVWKQTHLQADAGPQDFRSSWLKARLNTLVWPTGASRFGWFLGICSSNTASLLPSSGNLVISETDNDGNTARQISVPMFHVTSKALSFRQDHEVASPDKQQIYLVLLADKRFTFQRTSMGQYTVDQSTTWSAFINNVATELGISLSYTAPTSTFGNPHPVLTSNFDYAPLAMDAAARSVGTTFVAEFDGTFKLKTTADSVSALALNTAIQRAGDNGDDYLSVPSSIDCIFSHHGCDKFPYRRFGENVTAPAGKTTDGGSATLFTTAQANHTEDGSQTNAAAVTALASALANRYYDHIGRDDLIFDGILELTSLSGLHDRYLVEHSSRDLSIRLVARPRHLYAEWHYNSFNVDSPPIWGFWAKLGVFVLAQGGYEWEQAEHSSGTTFATVTNGITSGGDADATCLAYEVNDNRQIAANSIVWMSWSNVEGKFVFEHGGGGAVGFPFELTATLALGGSAAAETIDCSFATTGTAITVHDFMDKFSGPAGYQGVALYRPDCQAFEIVEMQRKARFIEVTLVEDMGQTTAGQSNAATIDTYTDGEDPGSTTNAFDLLGIYTHLVTDDQAICAWDDIDDKYVIIDAVQSGGDHDIGIVSSGTTWGFVTYTLDGILNIHSDPDAASGSANSTNALQWHTDDAQKITRARNKPDSPVAFEYLSLGFGDPAIHDSNYAIKGYTRSTFHGAIFANTWADSTNKGGQTLNGPRTVNANKPLALVGSWDYGSGMSGQSGTPDGRVMYLGGSVGGFTDALAPTNMEFYVANSYGETAPDGVEKLHICDHGLFMPVNNLHIGSNRVAPPTSANKSILMEAGTEATSNPTGAQLVVKSNGTFLCFFELTSDGTSRELGATAGGFAFDIDSNGNDSTDVSKILTANEPSPPIVSETTANEFTFDWDNLPSYAISFDINGGGNESTQITQLKTANEPSAGAIVTEPSADVFQFDWSKTANRAYVTWRNPQGPQGGSTTAATPTSIMDVTGSGGISVNFSPNRMNIGLNSTAGVRSVTYTNTNVGINNGALNASIINGVLRINHSYSDSATVKAAIVPVVKDGRKTNVSLYCDESPDVRFRDTQHEFIPNTGWFHSEGEWLFQIPVDELYLQTIETDTLFVESIVFRRFLAAGAAIDETRDGWCIVLRCDDMPSRNNDVTITLTAIRKGCLGMRFAEKTDDEMQKNNSFWEQAHG